MFTVRASKDVLLSFSSHGLTNSHSDAPVFDDLRSALLSAGYPVFMFDYLGSGNSDGSFEDKTWLNQRQCLQDALSFASTMGFEHPGQYLFGRSVGGALSGFFLNQTSVKGAVLASPPPSPRSSVREVSSASRRRLRANARQPRAVRPDSWRVEATDRVLRSAVRCRE
ncbi:alpha/beta fold hydrolase [Mycobacterium kyogaense]|uniref:alpha/beta fold hydrolase n=1 Tax=Mycobacterium kyogaense TaxID=2212479 RepID=UPI003FA552E0